MEQQTQQAQPTFAELCREQREQRYETYQAMADLIGVHWSTYYRWEQGESLPRRTETKRFAKRCKVAFEDVKAAVQFQQSRKTDVGGE